MFSSPKYMHKRTKSINKKGSSNELWQEVLDAVFPSSRIAKFSALPLVTDISWSTKPYTHS